MDNELKEILGTIIQKLNTFEDNQHKMQNDITSMQDKMSVIEDKVSVMQDKVSVIEDKVSVIEDKVSVIEDKVSVIEDDMATMQNSITDIKLSLENETNKSIQLLAENHCNLIDKLNQAIKVSDKNLLYEVQVNFLKGKVEHLEKEVAEIKSKIA